jgi:hypothetical protein
MRTALTVSIVIFLAACASSHIITGTPRPPIEPTQVKLYSSAPAKFEEIAIIEASSKSSWAFTDQQKVNVVIERLKEEAAKLGANGVLLQMTGSESAGGVVTGVSGGSNPAFGTGIYTSVMHKVGRALAIHVP